MVAESEKTPKLTQIVRRTLPLVGREIWRHKPYLLSIVFASVLLGLVPTFKSELESGVLQQINRVLASAPESMLQVFDAPVDRFANVNATREDWSQRAVKMSFAGLSLRRVILAYLLVAVLGYVIQLALTYAKSHIQQHVFGRLRAEAAKAVLTSDSCDLPRESNIAARYSSAIHQGAGVVAATYGYILDGGQHLFSIVTALLFVASKSIPFAFVFIVFVVAEAFLSVYQAKRLRKQRESFDQSRNALAAKTDEILAKREVILAWDQQAAYATELDEATQEYAQLDRDLDVREAKFSTLSYALYDLGRIVVLLLAIIIAAGWFRQRLDGIGDAYFLVALYVRLLSPATSLLMRYEHLKRSEATAATFLRLLAPSERRIAQMATGETTVGPLEIEFRDVSFRYDEDREILSNCSFVAPAGRVTLLVGPSGCGKSTVARLLLDFWRPTGGAIRVGNRDIATMSSSDLRLAISYVAQEDHVTDDSVLRNLQWANPTPTVKDAVAVLEELGIEDALERLDEPADDWSVGEQERLSLARLILDRSPIVIMDEPMTGLDPVRLGGILKNLPTLLGGGSRTILLISHQLAFASIADHVVMLSSAGSVKQTGSAADLRNSAGPFRDLVALAAGRDVSNVD